MTLPSIHHCPGTLAPGYHTYSTTCLRNVFQGRKVSHMLPYPSPVANAEAAKEFLENQKRMSISGVQEKYSVVLEKNKLRLTREGERGMYILKPAPRTLDHPDQMPANEHLTMQIARQIFKIETAENAMIFFSDGQPAYITRRFDVSSDGGKLAKEDFASLAGLTPQKDGEHYKYSGCYLDLFDIMKKYLPIYTIESLKLFRLIVFNYLFSNGDAHYKNFSIIETGIGDFRLSPAYDLLNTHLHVDDSPFALVDGLLPVNYAVGNIREQLHHLARLAEIAESQANLIMNDMLSHEAEVQKLIAASFFSDESKQIYYQQYQKGLQILNMK
jgi:serine/threonine-protein kinase HipA